MTSNPMLLAAAAGVLVWSSAALAQAPAAPKAAPAADAAPGPAAPAAGDPVKGQAGTRMCSGCHEIEGWHTAYPEVYHVPRIAGQNEAYIVAALKEYRAGERQHPSMRQIAASLSDADIANLAAYYARGISQVAAK